MLRLSLYSPDELLELARQARYSAQKLSRKLGVSQRTLNSYTQEILGCGTQDWLNEQRLAVAPEKLKQYRSVKLTADALGYEYPHYFSTLFWKRYKLWPTEFLA